MEHERYDIAIVGGGLAGLTAALALAEEKRNILLIAPKPATGDGRTTALLWQSVASLKTLGLWEIAGASAHPLQVMRIVDATSRLIRAPQADFLASEVGIPAFGYNIVNREALAALAGEIKKHPSIKWHLGNCGNIHEANGGVDLVVGKATYRAGIVVAADGRNSLVRARAEIGVREWQYPQQALVVDFEHEFDSGSASTELHTETGPFTVVPQTATRAGLVWMTGAEEAAILKELDEIGLAARIETRMQSFLGKVRIVSKPAVFPVSGLMANRFGKGRIVLVGEAAHAFPPIGAQGFNLGLRDIECLCELVANNMPAETLGDTYHNQRQRDVATRTAMVDLFNRTLLTGFLPVSALRAAVLGGLAKFAPLRKLAMQAGIGPGFAADRQKSPPVQ